MYAVQQLSCAYFAKVQGCHGHVDIASQGIHFQIEVCNSKLSCILFSLLKGGTHQLQLLTPVQVARCMVQGWPYTPDTLAICSWVAAEDGDAGALAVLTASNNRPAPASNASWGGISNPTSFPGTDNRSSFSAATENRNGFAAGPSRGSFDASEIRGRRGQL